MDTGFAARVVWIRNVNQCAMQRMGDGEYRLQSDAPIVLEKQVGGPEIATLNAGVYRVSHAGPDVLFEKLQDTQHAQA